ncbi:hypothetical protein M514_07977 [Trichuris suis]|uniref:Uncharacterized protein n=1 Tax=Trichuris suis TaxID=68888 RepID=A0A085N3N8_9BILA|nr:hypothetical protein M513_07977 [Trichuris suis]KFD64084.1 hypothetical protein M514_07977 [Trichuris suis]
MRCVWLRLAPESISVDYELASMNAAKAVVIAAPVCCSFNIFSNTKSRLAEQGLLTRYRSDAEIPLHV